MGQSTLATARAKARILAGPLADAWPAAEPPSGEPAPEVLSESGSGNGLHPCTKCKHMTFNPDKCGGCLRRQRGKRQQRDTGLLVLYRHYDSKDELLYVGQTIDPPARWRQHRLKSDWSREVALTRYEYFDSKAELDEAEDQAIKQERPPWNVALTGRQQSHAAATHSE